MNVSDIEKGIFKRIELTAQQKKAGISAIVFGFVAHMYFMCNMIFNDDSISAYYLLSDPYGDPFVGASSGRWLLKTSSYLTTWFRPPFLCGVLIILCMAILGIIIVDLMNIKTSAGAITCGGLVVVFPSVIAYMSLWDIGYALSFFLPVLAIYLIEKGKSIALSVFICGIGLSIMPINVMGVIVLCIYIFVGRILTVDDITYESVWKPLIKQVLVVMGGMLIVYAGIWVSTHMSTTSTEITSYQGASEVVSGTWINNLAIGIETAFSKTLKVGYGAMQMIPQLKFSFILCYCIQILSVLALTVINKLYKKISKLVLLLLAIAFLPIAVSLISVLSPGFQYSLQHRMQWVFILCGAWMLSERVIEAIWEDKDSRKKICKILYCIVAVNMGLMLYGFTVTDNIVHRALQYVTEKDTALCTRILAKLDSDANFSYEDNPVYFINVVSEADENNTTSVFKAEPELYKTIIMDIETNLWCYGDRTIRAHMSLYEGVDFLVPDDNVINRISSKWGEIEHEHGEMHFGDFDVFRFEETDTYVVVLKSQVSYGIIENR